MKNPCIVAGQVFGQINLPAVDPDFRMNKLVAVQPDHPHLSMKDQGFYTINIQKNSGNLSNATLSQ